MAAELVLDRLRRAGRLVILLLLVAGVVVVWRERGALDPVAIETAIAHAPAAPLVFLAAHILASLLFIPRTVLAVAAGLLFGMVWGIVWAALGSVLGAVAGFLVARYLNDGALEPENMRRIGPMLRRAEEGGWRAVTMMRLIPVIPHSLSNYALGLTKLPLGSYAVGSLLGQLPMTVAYVDLGAAGEQVALGRAGWLVPTLIALAALILSLVLPWIYRARR
jgi:uncharacterized membrane protein YdjX (TVP38/TMEM64 family)